LDCFQTALGKLQVLSKEMVNFILPFKMIVLVTLVFPSYVESQNQEDHGSRPTYVKKFEIPSQWKKCWLWWHVPVILTGRYKAVG
jgi:hypothetical protein